MNRKNMKTPASFVLAAVAVTLSASAFAQFAKPEDAIKYRKASMTIQATHFGRVAAMASGRVPFDAKVAADNAAVAESMSKLAWPAFVEGSDKGDTKAKPEIWSEPAKFKEANEKLQAEMTKLVAATKTGNLDSIKASVGAVGGSCKACHDAFRKE
jgi:cytochrome c556